MATASQMALEHIADQDLEAYSLGRLPETATEPLEEHLLICGHCQDRLLDWDQYCRAIRAAGRLVKAPRAARQTAPRTNTASPR
jgi:anti-sigma factor RsiW